MKYEHLISLISNSQLFEEQKADLIALLNNERVEEFFDRFYEYFSQDVERRMKVLNTLTDTYDTLADSIEEQMNKKKEEIYIKLENELKDADSSSRDLIWNEYYSQIEEVNNTYKDKLKEVLPTISREYIKR